MTILVTGATGNIGGHVLRALTEGGHPVRAYDRISDPHAAMAGVDRLFLACGNVPGQKDFECAMIDAAASAGVSRVVKLSGPDADEESRLIFERWHGEIERHLAASGLPRVLLRPRTFMSNLFAYAGSVAATGTVFAPAGTAEISFVDPRDVAEVAAVCLTGTGHEGRTYTLTGPEAITYARVCEELGTVLGRPIAYVPVSDDDARSALLGEGLPPFLADAIVAIFASQRAGSMADTTETVSEVIGRKPRPIGEFLKEMWH